MSEPITEMDIKNWREYYSEIPEYEMLGRDFFTISCMDTIDALRAELGMKNDALESYAEFYDQAAAACGLTDANPGSATDEIILSRLSAYDNLRKRIAELELRLDVGTGNLADVVPFPLIAENARLREIIRNTFDTLADNINGVKL